MLQGISEILLLILVLDIVEMHQTVHFVHLSVFMLQVYVYFLYLCYIYVHIYFPIYMLQVNKKYKRKEIMCESS